MFMGRTSDTPTITAVTATVRKYGQFYALTEEVDLFNVNGTTLELVGVLGESAGRSLNHLQRTIAEGSGVTARLANGVASEGVVVAVIALADIANVINTLVRNGSRPFTPMTTGSQNIGTSAILPSFWGICHPDVAYDVSQISGFVGVQNYAGQTQTAVGEFGLIQTAGFGVRFLQTQEAGINLDGGGTNAGGIRGTSDTDTYDVPIYGQDAFGSVGLGTRHTDGVYRTGENEGNFELVMHPKGSGGVADPFNEVSTIAWKAWWAGAVLNAAFSRRIVCGATAL
jgi:N4-gp56 family major capsid protein